MRIGKIMSVAASEFPPKAIRAIVHDVALLLKERKETVSVAETVCITVDLGSPEPGFWDFNKQEFS